MNNVAILPSTLMYLLQNQNIKRDVVKKIDITKSQFKEQPKEEIKEKEKEETLDKDA